MRSFNALAGYPQSIATSLIRACARLRWPQLSEQYFRVDKWSLCQG